jgi:hypothetical protein
MTHPRENEMVAEVAHWFDLGRDLIPHESSHRWVRAWFAEFIRRGGSALLHVITEGHAGNPDADIALRAAYADQLRLLGAAGVCPFLATYVAHPGPLHDRKGWAKADRYLRNRMMACFVAFAVEEWGLPYSKSRDSETISASTVVSKAAHSRGCNVGHRHLENFYRECRGRMPRHLAWRELEARVEQFERDVAAVGKRIDRYLKLGGTATM